MISRRNIRSHFALFVAIFAFVFPLFTHAATLNRPLNNLGLVGWYTFDNMDMQTNVKDRSGNGQNGKLESFSATTTTIGKVGQALTFDGSDDIVRLSGSNTGALDFTAGPFTIMAWVNCSGQGSIIAKRNTDTDIQYQLQLVDFTGTKYFQFLGNATGGAIYGEATRGSTAISCGQWYHAAVTVDGSGNITMYVNGVAESLTDTDGSRPFTYNHVNTDASLGARYHTGPATFYNFPGSLDDVRMYNRALTQGEIKNIYNGVNSKISTSYTPAGLKNGLVGHWTFDSDDLKPNVRDVSGSGNHGNLSGQTSTTTAIGQVGQALSFDGSDDVINVTNESNFDFERTDKFSFSGWIKWQNSTGFNQSFFSKFNSGSSIGIIFRVETNSALTVLFIDSDGSVIAANGSGGSFPPNIWRHVVFTYDGSSSGSGLKIYVDGVLYSTGTGSIANTILNNDPVRIGYSHSTFYFKGDMDDAYVYNRVLSVSEIKQLYSMGGPKVNSSTNGSAGTLGSGLIGWWTFDSKDLQPNVRDRSGNGNHGRLMGQTSTSTVIGKLGQGLSFAAASDYVNLGDLSAVEGQSNLTWSVWVKDNFTGSGCFIGKADPSFATGEVFEMGNLYSGFFGTTNDVSMYISGTGSDNHAIGPLFYSTGNPLISNQWNHVVAVFDGTQTGNSNRLKMYVNGNQVSGGYNGANIPATTQSSSQDTVIGNSSDLTCGTNGSLDDVRIYSRSLSASEVKQLYNMGR